MPERFFPLIKFSSLNPCCFHRSLVSLRFIFVRHFWSSVRALAYCISVYLTQEQNPDTDFFFFSFLFYLFIFLVVFVIHWHESSMDLHVFPIPIPPPTSLSTRSLWVFPLHQVWALVSCIQPGLVICFTLDNIHVSMLFSWNIPSLPSPTESKRLFYKSVSSSFFFFCSAYRVIINIFLNSIYMC